MGSDSIDDWILNGDWVFNGDLILRRLIRKVSKHTSEAAWQGRLGFKMNSNN